MRCAAASPFSLPTEGIPVGRRATHSPTRSRRAAHLLAQFESDYNLAVSLLSAGLHSIVTELQDSAITVATSFQIPPGGLVVFPELEARPERRNTTSGNHLPPAPAVPSPTHRAQTPSVPPQTFADSLLHLVPGARAATIMPFVYTTAELDVRARNVFPRNPRFPQFLLDSLSPIHPRP